MMVVLFWLICLLLLKGRKVMGRHLRNAVLHGDGDVSFLIGRHDGSGDVVVVDRLLALVGIVHEGVSRWMIHIGGVSHAWIVMTSIVAMAAMIVVSPIVMISAMIAMTIVMPVMMSMAKRVIAAVIAAVVMTIVMTPCIIMISMMVVTAIMISVMMASIEGIVMSVVVVMMMPHPVLEENGLLMSEVVQPVVLFLLLILQPSPLRAQPAQVVTVPLGILSLGSPALLLVLVMMGEMVLL